MHDSLSMWRHRSHANARSCLLSLAVLTGRHAASDLG